mgnify:CR=1 FL=1
MKVSYENIKPDNNSCFRVLHLDSPVEQLKWEYHYHPEIELVCVVDGSGTRHVGYHKSIINNGDLVLIGSNVPHSGFGMNAIDPHEEIVVQFKQEIINFPQNLKEFNLINKMISMSRFGISFGSEVKNKILPKLYQLLETENTKRYLLLLEILQELAENNEYTLLNAEVLPYTFIKKNRERLETIFTYVEKNYHKEIDIAVVAQLSNLTLPAFCNFFKKTTQITFTEFVNRYRIDKACTFLIQDKSVAESCYNNGFNNVTYFNRLFKKYLNKTPSEYKEEWQNNG